MSLELIEAARILRYTLDRWPETFTADLATALQSWRPDQDNRAWSIRCSDLRTLFRMAMKAGTVQVTTTTAQVPTQQRRVFSHGVNSGWGDVEWDRPGQRRWPQPAGSKEVETHHVTAASFASWLAENELEPSQHVAAWLKARGVQTQSSAIEPPAEPQPLARESTQQRNARWLAVFDEEKLRQPVGAQARAVRSIVEAEGVTAATAKKGIQKAEIARAESYRDGGVTPLKRKPARPATPFDMVMKPKPKPG